MGGTVLLAVLSVGAVIYSFGRLFNAYANERERARVLAVHRARLDQEYAVLTAQEQAPTPAGPPPQPRPLSEYDKGFLDGAILRHEQRERGALRAGGSAAHAG